MHHVFFSALYKQREKEGYYTEVELVEIEKNNEKGVLWIASIKEGGHSR